MFGFPPQFPLRSQAMQGRSRCTVASWSHIGGQHVEPSTAHSINGIPGFYLQRKFGRAPKPFPRAPMTNPERLRQKKVRDEKKKKNVFIRCMSANMGGGMCARITAELRCCDAPCYNGRGNTGVDKRVFLSDQYGTVRCAT